MPDRRGGCVEVMTFMPSSIYLSSGLYVFRWVIPCLSSRMWFYMFPLETENTHEGPLTSFQNVTTDVHATIILVDLLSTRLVLIGQFKGAKICP